MQNGLRLSQWRNLDSANRRDSDSAYRRETDSANRRDSHSVNWRYLDLVLDFLKIEMKFTCHKINHFRVYIQ